MRLRNLSFLILLLLPSGVSVSAQGKLDHLKVWANSEPIDCTRKPCKSIFRLKEVRQPLLKLLRSQNYKRLIDSFDLVRDSDLIGGYLVIEGFTRLKIPYEHVVVAIKLYDGTFHVGFANGGSPEWYSTSGKPGGIPECIRNRIEP